MNFFNLQIQDLLLRQISNFNKQKDYHLLTSILQTFDDHWLTIVLFLFDGLIGSNS